ncbi:MAG: type IV toxin-antitoxin system AbiEi family antitoxin domain-containing protein [Bdellovibrio sp.]
MRIVQEMYPQLYPEIDYQALMAEFHHLSHPRRKLKELQNKGLLIRLKKGFYVLSADLVGKEYSPQIVANLLYGPSYLSLEYALSYYHLIPERVEHFTSVTSEKNKVFKTQLGHFTYRHISPSLYPLGVTLRETTDNRTFLIASVEKTLMDVFTLRFNSSDLPKKEDVESAIEEDLRIDLKELKKQLNKESLAEMKEHYKNRRWNKLVLEFLLGTL